MHRLATPSLVVLALIAASLARSAEPDEKPAPPIETDIVEKAKAQLVQVEVSVTGPREVIETLTAADFELRVRPPGLGPFPMPGATEVIEDFHIDAVCADRDPVPTAEPSEAEAVAEPGTPVNYLFYFDQQHLTLEGRQRSIDLASTLIDQLVAGGSRAMILSNASRLDVVAELTGDAPALHAALERLEHDRRQFEVYAQNEEERVNQLAEQLEDGFGLGPLVTTARRYQYEEVYLADRSLRRLELALSRFAEVPGSRVAFYFADTMRANAGEHFMSFFGAAVLNTQAAQALQVDNIQAQPAFDRMVNTAVALGIRFYPVQGRGLIAYFDRAPSVFTGSVVSTNTVRQRDSEKTLYDLATETGGRAFVHGEGAARIAQQIRADFACVYIVSFPVEGIPLDTPLALVLTPKRSDVRVRTQGRIVAQSEGRKTATRLLSGFLFERGADSGSQLEVTVIPTGYRDGAFTALLQIGVPGTSLRHSRWDVGASVVFRDRVREEVSGRLELTREGVPGVFEAEIELRPGAHEIVAVAHELTSNLVLSEHLEVHWPDPDEQPATLIPVTLLQPYAAAYSREGVTRTLGARARSDLESLDIEQPLALVGLVCRSRSQRGSWTFERAMVGSTRMDFPPMQVELGEERCIQVRDLLPAGSLGPGTYRYEARLVLGPDAVEEVAREFHALPSEL